MVDPERAAGTTRAVRRLELACEVSLGPGTETPTAISHQPSAINEHLSGRNPRKHHQQRRSQQSIPPAIFTVYLLDLCATPLPITAHRCLLIRPSATLHTTPSVNPVNNHLASQASAHRITTSTLSWRLCAIPTSPMIYDKPA